MAKRPRRDNSPPREQPTLIFGFHAIQAALELAETRVLEVWLVQGRQDARATEMLAAAEAQDLNVQYVERQVLDDMLPEAQHQGVIARCRPIAPGDEVQLFQLLDALDEPPFLLILDGVQDPHNLGACLRTAEAAGVHAVIAPKDRATGLTNTVLKVSSGAAERLPFIQVTNLARLLRELRDRGVWIVGTSGDSEGPVFDANLTGSLAVILGAEGRGIRRLTREHCDHVVDIPMRGGAESLNVSVAAGVCLFEAVRQRGL